MPLIPEFNPQSLRTIVRGVLSFAVIGSFLTASLYLVFKAAGGEDVPQIAMTGFTALAQFAGTVIMFYFAEDAISMSMGGAHKAVKTTKQTEDISE